MKKLKSGDTVMVYEDPITKRQMEGTATVYWRATYVGR